MLKNRELSVTAIERRFTWLRTILSLVIAMIVAFLLIATVSETPLHDFCVFVFGPMAGLDRMSIILEKFIPILFTGTAVCLMYSGGQINLGAEGAFFAGAVAATAVAIQPGIPTGVHFVLCALAGAAAGAVICGIPGYLNVKFNIMVVVSSLMINYVALYLGLYLIMNVLFDPQAGFAASYAFASSAKLPVIIPGTRVHLGLVLGLLAAAGGYVLLYKTSYGYKVRTIGQNLRFATYSGIPVEKTIISLQLLAGALAGLGGTTEILGLYNRFSYSNFTNHGWDGIMLAVLAHNNPKSIPLAALFLAYIRTGSDVLSRMTNIPTEIVKIVQSVVIVLTCASGLLKKQEHRAIVRHSQLAGKSKEA